MHVSWVQSLVRGLDPLTKTQCSQINKNQPNKKLHGIQILICINKVLQSHSLIWVLFVADFKRAELSSCKGCCMAGRTEKIYNVAINRKSLSTFDLSSQAVAVPYTILLVVSSIWRAYTGSTMSSIVSDVHILCKIQVRWFVMFIYHCKYE